MFGEIVDYFDKEVTVGIVVKNAWDQKILSDILSKYVKRYDIELSEIDDTEVSIGVVKLSHNRYTALTKALNDYDYNLITLSSAMNIVKMVSYK